MAVKQAVKQFYDPFFRNFSENLELFENDSHYAIGNLRQAFLGLAFHLSSLQKAPGQGVGQAQVCLPTCAILEQVGLFGCQPIEVEPASERMTLTSTLPIRFSTSAVCLQSQYEAPYTHTPMRRNTQHSCLLWQDYELLGYCRGNERAVFQGRIRERWRARFSCSRLSYTSVSLRQVEDLDQSPSSFHG